MVMSCERETYLIEKVFPNAARSGKFGSGMKFVRFEKDNDTKAGVQFASSIVFLSVVVSNCESDNDKKENFYKVVIKFLPESPKVREVMNSEVQFYNENVMYSDVLPFLNYNNIVTDLFSKFYYGESCHSDDKEPVIVVEDLREKNFKISKFKLFLDYEHVIVALRALGKFHALSYIAKQKHPDEFYKIRMKLKEHAWDREGDSLVDIIGPCSLRGINALRSIKNSDTLKQLSARLEYDSLELAKYFVEPEEPTAVICHGDFCNHNVLFKYDPDRPDIPTAIKFFDLQTSRYASPVIDLSMILYLNTDYELRSRHWEEFISAYYNSVYETVTSAECIPPTYEQLIVQFKNKSFYGYLQCSYFLPIMLSDSPPPSVEESCELSRDELIKTLCSNGGEKGTQGLVSIVKHLDELNYFGFLNK